MNNINNNLNDENNENRKKVINYGAFQKPEEDGVTTEKYKLTLFMAVFFGIFGAHRFMHKKYVTGILMLLSCGGFLLWTFIDIYLIISRKYKDADGNTLYYGGEFYEYPPNLFAICLSIFFFSMLYNFIGSTAEPRPTTTSTTQNVEAELGETKPTVEQTSVQPEVSAEVPETQAEAPTNSNTSESSSVVTRNVSENPNVIKTSAYSDITGMSFGNSYNSDADIVINDITIKESPTEKDKYNIKVTLYNQNTTETYKNVVVKFIISSKDGSKVEHNESLVTDEVLKPGEQKAYNTVKAATGEVTEVQVELVSYDVIQN